MLQISLLWRMTDLFKQNEDFVYLARGWLCDMSKLNISSLNPRLSTLVYHVPSRRMSGDMDLHHRPKLQQIHWLPKKTEELHDDTISCVYMVWSKCQQPV